MPIPSLHSHYRNFITITDRSVPHASPNHWCRFPLSIWSDSIEFTCSLKWPVLCSCQFNPGCGVASIFRASATLVIGTNVTTYFPHRNLRYRGFFTDSLSFSSTVPTYRDQSPRFSLTVHHNGVSTTCSVRWFDSCSGKPPSEGLSLDCSKVFHPFQSIQLSFKVGSSHTRFAALRRRGF